MKGTQEYIVESNPHAKVENNSTFSFELKKKFKGQRPV